MTTSIRSGASDIGILLNGVEELTLTSTTPPTTANAQGSGINELTRKDYVDGVALGVGQTYSTFTSGTRATNTNYTNSTGRPIFLIAAFNLASSATAVLVVDGVTILTVLNSNANGVYLPITAVIPNGAVYKITYGGFISWAELR